MLVVEKRISLLGAILPVMETFKLVFLPFAITVLIKEHPELLYLLFP